MVSINLIIVCLIPSFLQSTNINPFDTSDDNDNADASETRLTITVLIEASPSYFYTRLPSFLEEISTALNLTTTVSQRHDKYQVFAIFNGSRELVAQNDTSNSDATFVEVVLEIDIMSCGSNNCLTKDDIYSIIDNSRQTFSFLVVYLPPPLPFVFSFLAYLPVVIGGFLIFFFLINIIMLLKNTFCPTKSTNEEKDIELPDRNTTNAVANSQEIETSNETSMT